MNTITFSSTSSSIFKQIQTASQHALWAVGVFSFCINLLNFTIPLYMMQLFDRVLASRSFDTLIYLTLIALVAVGVLALLDFVRGRIVAQIGQWLEVNLGPWAIRSSIEATLQNVTASTQSLRDIQTLRQFSSSPSVFILFDLPWSPLFLLVIFLLHPLLGLLAFLGMGLLFSLAFINEYLTRHSLQKANSLNLGNTEQTEFALRNAETVQAMGMLTHLISRWHQNNNLTSAQQLKATYLNSIIIVFSKFCRLAGQLIVLGTGALLVVKHRITPGAMIAASIFFTRALTPIEQAMSAWRQWVNVREAKKRLSYIFSHTLHHYSTVKFPSPIGYLKLENVTYIAPHQKSILLSQINYSLPPQKILAILGPSGTGKSTLAKLIVGIWKPTQGSVRLDEIDVYSWERTDFGNYIGYLPQDIELFNVSIKENIARLGTIDDEAILTAAKIAGIHDVVVRLPQGYDTVIGHNGYQLSGGQRQLIALARAIYRFPKLLVLDEPNSHLDNEGEQALIKALGFLRQKGSTIIVIAQRPSVIQCADELMLLRNGKIQAVGPKDQILPKIKMTSFVNKELPHEKIANPV